jgi:hypothetical protein
MLRKQTARAWPFVTTILFIAGMLHGCASIQTGSYADEGANFADYRTFSWLKSAPYIGAEGAAPINPLAHSMIVAAIRAQLVARGFAFTDDREGADFLVSYTIGERDKIRMDSYPVGYRGHWGWHIPYDHYFFRKIEIEQYTQGTLGVDIFDNETGRPVWHGWASKTVTERDRRDPGPTIERGISKLFKSFPG